MSREQEHITRLVDHLFREESGKLNAILTRIFGFQHLKLIEDIVQDTFLAALRRWPYHGVPDNPSAWLMQVAKNRALNALKRKSKSRNIDDLPVSARPGYGTGSRDGSDTATDPDALLGRLFLDHEIRDSQMRVLFTCCNPVLSEKSQIILTLKTLCGFSMKEIARALFMNEEAVKKSLYRSRKTVRGEDLAFGVPFLHQAEERIGTVNTVLYLMFNEGYKRTGGVKLVKEDLCYEAARLTRLVIETVPADASESLALLALICFNSSRFASRINGDGEIVDLKEQDRTLWDRDLVDRGFYYLRKARDTGRLSRYHLEAGIAAVHCAAQSWDDTDWQAILFYYDRMLELEENPVVRINRAIALSNLRGPDAGLQALAPVEDEETLGEYHLLHAAKADMYRRQGRFELARSYYAVALDLAESRPDKDFIRKKIRECDLENIKGN